MNISNRIYKNPLFVPQLSSHYIGLSDYVMSYYNGTNWKIIPLKDALQYPIIYDKYNGITDISITFCPYSYSCIIYFNLLVATNKIHRNNIVLALKNNKDTIIEQLTGKIHSKNRNRNRQTSFLRRSEVKIMTLRSALSLYPDCLFFQNNKKIKPLAKIKDNIIIYGILYKDVNTIILSNKKFDYIKDGYFDYFKNNMDDIKIKGGIIIPCSKDAWLKHFPDSKIVYI